MTRRAAACRYFEPELRTALEAEGLSDVALIPFKGPCESCSGARGAPICLEPGTMLLAGRCACVPGADPCFDSCFGLLLGEDLVRRFLSQGLHLLTPEMVRTWRENARVWGFTPETARSFFRESITGFRAIDCGATPVPLDELAALAEYAGVPADVWPASLDHLRLWLRLVFAERPKRSEDDGKAASWRLSDFAMAYDLIGGLLARETEGEVGQGIVELFTLLCAPSAVSLRVLAVPGADGWSCRMPDDPPSAEEQEALLSLPVGNALAGPDGFTLCLPGSVGPMAHLWIGGIALPDRRSHYLQLGTMLAPVLGLALADSRRRNQLVAQEVALRTHLERALLGAIVDSSHDAIIGQGLEGIITTWNQGAVRMFGHAAEEAIGRHKDLLIPPERIPEDREAMQRLLRGERVMPFETVRLRKDGTRIEASLAISPIRSLDGKIVGASRITRDISELKQAEARILRLNEDLERRVLERTAQFEDANRALENSNKELESFSYSVSHDLRAPLRAIDGFRAILEQEFATALGPTGKEYLDRMRNASRRMSQLIDDLLDLSRIGRSKLLAVHLDLGRMAKGVLDELAQADPARRVEVLVAPGLEAFGDSRLVSIALENLLGNAWKYTRLAAEPRIEVGRETVAGETVYFVKDNGTGFDMQYAAKLFTPFQRLHADPRFEGTGIGLATVQRIIHRHGGRLWGEAKPDLGATFSFTLPGQAAS